MYAFFQFFCTTLAGTGMLIVAKEWSVDAVVFATGLIFLSFYLQSMWTEGRKLAIWLEWLKLGLVLASLNSLPLNQDILLTLKVYLVISVLSLAYLAIQPLRQAAPG